MLNAGRRAAAAAGHTGRLRVVLAVASLVVALTACGPGTPRTASPTASFGDGTYTTSITDIQRRDGTLALRVGGQDLPVRQGATAHTDGGDMDVGTWASQAPALVPGHARIVRLRVEDGQVTDVWPSAARLDP